MTKFALLIGVSECAGGFKPLPSAVVNVDALHDVLVDPQRGEFLAKNIKLLKNPNVREIEKAIYWLFNKRKKDDLLLLYFSGHGIVNYDFPRSGLYLATRITRKQDNGSLYGGSDDPSALSAAYLRHQIESSNSQRQVIILDCCYSDTVASSIITIMDDGTVKVGDYLGGKGSAILTSSTTAREVSMATNINADGSIGLSIYTHYLVEGLTTGAADLDKDGMISVDELHEYAAKKVKIAAPAATPEFYPLSDGSKIAIAKSPTDPKLEYEDYLLQLCARIDRRENFFPIQLKTLATKQQQKLGISPEDASTIEERVLQPYREYLKKLVAYERELTLTVQEGYPLAHLLTDLKEYQQELKLLDEDIAEIHWRVLPPIEPTQTTISLSTFSFETAQVKVNKVNSGLFGGTKLEIEIVKTSAQAQHFVEELGNGVELDMVYVPGGQFMMGADDREFEEYLNYVNRNFDMGYTKLAGRPQHAVNVPDLLMSKYPVTQAQYETIIRRNPSHFKGSQRPVERVSWDDAQTFCQKLAQQTNKPYRLPSEAEWEYACRAGTKTPFYFGETISPDVVNHNGKHPYSQAPKCVHRAATTDVGIFPANAFGLYDLHGNVLEWCQDTWHENYQGAPTDGSPWLDENDGNNDYQLLRGGSWGNHATECRSAFRARNAISSPPQNSLVPHNSLGFRHFCIGFRLALSYSPGLL
jgi:formylglycine-generating enzyme required for sulfatase activity